MKSRWLTYFTIALGAELGNTWAQSRFHVVSDLEPGAIYYPKFLDFMIIRLVVWSFLYVGLGAAKALFTKLLQRRHSL